MAVASLQEPFASKLGAFGPVLCRHDLFWYAILVFCAVPNTCDRVLLLVTLVLKAILGLFVKSCSRGGLEKRRNFAKGTSFEIIESHTEQDLLFKDLETYAKARGIEAAPAGKQARAMLEVGAEAAMAQVATLSMLALQDEDTTNTAHRPKVQRTRTTRKTANPK